MLLPLDSLVIAPVGQFLSAAVVHLVDALDILELVSDEGQGVVGHQMVSMAAWVADREREVIPRRTGLAAKTTVISIPIRV